MIEREGYDAHFFEPLFAIEDRHFWFRIRNEVIVAMLSHTAKSLPPRFSMLEAGCGTGNVLRAMSEAFPQALITGMDLFSDGLRFAAKRGSKTLVQADITSMPFASHFNVIGLFDVLEHLPDEQSVLVNLASILRRDGRLLVTVPALPSLWSYFDVASHHCRRYTRETLSAALLQAGYRVEFISYYMMSLVPLVWTLRILSRSSVDSADTHSQALNELQVTPGLNGVLYALLKLESQFVMKRHPLPIGTSLVAVAIKTSDSA